MNFLFWANNKWHNGFQDFGHQAPKAESLTSIIAAEEKASLPSTGSRTKAKPSGLH